MVTHSSVLTWRIPWREEPGGLQSMGSQRVGLNWVTNTHKHTHQWLWIWSKEVSLTVLPSFWSEWALFPSLKLLISENGSSILPLKCLGPLALLEKEMATLSSILAWKNPMDRGARWATVHRISKSQTWLGNYTFTQTYISEFRNFHILNRYYDVCIYTYIERDTHYIYIYVVWGIPHSSNTPITFL